jgi:pimeloyl-ACP methyl ester carboxylesterase
VNTTNRPELRRLGYRRTVRRALVVLAVLLGLPATGCDNADPADAPGPASSPAPRSAEARAPLAGLVPCRSSRGRVERRTGCGTLEVPLDRRGRVPGRLRLAYAVRGRGRAPRGVILLLSGGPGQPGTDLAIDPDRTLRRALRGYRLVGLAQRGTGHAALRCRGLQRAIGTSDLRIPPPGVAAACAHGLGRRRAFFSTADSVVDIEALRRRLGARRMTIMGTSYGTFVAERYALAHPDRVERLVLDSVVPQEGVDLLEPTLLSAVPGALRDACRPRCGVDPERLLAGVVARSAPARSVGLLDAVVALSVFDPAFPGVLETLRADAANRRAPLDRLIARVQRGERAPASVLSQGLHAATLCAESPAPWGGPDAPLAGRRAALRRAIARLRPDDLAPFDRRTLAANGLLRTCLEWPPTAAPPRVDTARAISVPALILSGDRDLSTPRAWARRELRHLPNGRLVAVPKEGHSALSDDPTGAAHRALERFLAE